VWCVLQPTLHGKHRSWLLRPALRLTARSAAAGSDPANGTEKKMGAFLMMTCFLCTTVSSGMFITAMAANPLAVNLASETLGYTISWGAHAQPPCVANPYCRSPPAKH
jgi:di/tricarboxylate transporter